ncbi:MAG: TolC family outer membrane protein [Rudaea sp.]|nr:TolC family outer membrane protein [Rudaea sp.]
MLTSIRRNALTLALATACVSMPAPAEDLMQIYQQARQADPTLAIADATKAAVGEGVDQARAALLPQISASLGYLHDDGNSNTISPETNASNTGLVFLPVDTAFRNRTRQAQGVLTQSLFNWGNITRLRGARETAQASGSDYDAAQQDLLVRTATAYFGVLTAEDQLSFAQANEKALARQLDQAEQRYQVGLSAITDVHEARANHDSAVAQVISSQNAVDTARESVSQITGKDFGDLKKLREQLPLEKPQPAELQSWVDVAVKQSPLLASKQHSLDAAQINISTQRSGHLPTLNASIVRTDTPAWGSNATSFNGTALQSSPATGLNNDTAIGITLNVPIFTGGLVSSQVRQAVFQRDVAQDQVELQRRAVVANTRNAYRAVIAGISEVEATKQAVISAQSALDATQAGFEVGTRTIVDVLLSQQSLFQAQSAYSQARHQFVLSGLQLKESAGVVEAKDIEAVNALLE